MLMSIPYDGVEKAQALESEQLHSKPVPLLSRGVIIH
jgi:hypothetical protein